MCGFIGVYRYYNSKGGILLNSETTRNILRHRGPDDKGYYEDENIAMNFNRLSIIDLSEAAHQPMSNEDNNIWLVFNGEIFNYIELRNELLSKGHKFKSNSDSETIIHAYEEYGVECLSKFNGMWSFVIYDKGRNMLFCSRDRYGIKPFYYYKDSERMVFASEIKAILKAGIRSEPNEKQIFNYLAFGKLDLGNETMFKNVYQLKPAHYICVNSEGLYEKRYWYLKDERNIRDIAEGDERTSSRFRELFFDSVRLRLRSDVPIGILLSGGLDSSAIACAVGRIKEDFKLDIDLKAFTACYEKVEIDESRYAESVIERTGIGNVLVYPKCENVVADIERLIYYQDEPPASMTAFAHWNLMKEIKRYNIKVVLSGQGSDEMLGGYLGLSAGYHLLDLLSSVKLEKFCKEASLLRKRSSINYKTQVVQIGKAMVSRRLGLLIKAFFRDKSIQNLNNEFIKAHWNNYDYRKKHDKYSILNNHLYRMFSEDSLPLILHYEDRNSMAFSIEQRMPFLDFRLVEFIFSLSNRQKINGGISKVILRRALSDILPDMIKNRYSKLGFTVPQSEWISGLQGYLKDIFNSDEFKKRPYWNSKKVLRIYKNHVENRENAEDFLWRIIACEVWHRVFSL